MAHGDFRDAARAFLKIAVRVEELRSRIKVAFPSAYPHAPVLALLAGSVTVRVRRHCGKRRATPDPKPSTRCNVHSPTDRQTGR